MSTVDASRTVGELVAERPGRSRVFEQFRIDYCCGGRLSVDEASRRAGIEAERLLEAIREADAAPSGEDERNWAEAPPSELVDHIVDVHHAFLRRELPRLTELIAKVDEAHGAKHSELADVRSTFEAMRRELEQHMAKEEMILFPAIKSPAGLPPAGSLDGPIQVMEHEHDSAGQALERLHDLTGGYAPPADACNSYRAMLDGLAALESDLHRHIHEENNILFPRFSGPTFVG